VKFSEATHNLLEKSSALLDTDKSNVSLRSLVQCFKLEDFLY